MIPSSRIHRGFHRVGVVLAALALLLAVFVALQSERSVAFLLVGIAVLLYAAARALGWIIAGFIGSDDSPSR